MSEKRQIQTYSQPGGFQFKMIFDIKQLSQAQIQGYLQQLWAGLISINIVTRTGCHYILEDLPEIKWLYNLITSDLSESMLLDEIDFHRKGVFEFKVRSEELIPVMTSLYEIRTSSDGTQHYYFHDLDKLITKRWFLTQLQWVVARTDFTTLKLTDNSYFEREESVIRSFQSRYEGELD